MAWFNARFEFNQSQLKLAHITDTHLFEQSNGEYFSVNTAEHFTRVLADLALQNLDAVIFGGDLTQDHTFASYQLFARLIDESALTCPVFWLPGNHDDIGYLNEISQGQIISAKKISFALGQVLLLDSKGPTPSGWVSEAHLEEVTGQCVVPSLVFCHHNPLAIQGYLDKHMLENGPQLLNRLVDSQNVIALFHGHVHNEYVFRFRELPVYATPATSIQFKKFTNDWQQENPGAGYRIINWSEGGVQTEVKWLTK
ncbi:3',5'-cyclic-nucleotide phosphodiesterase [Pseudoalteromonas luteoviolacea]|uniref:3',5'-cyclic-nucleotide phosphodiesterase n=1 Tax=Pseudoalteromonas luteoviolacea TaxID=43657 RepID=A0A0C1MK95_9GAMM|nr:metallophosphoesterase [Pseudoalteromonas luteoviolacea]KID54858.1 3',5'-cyclic-nucleotide phosphodiesterase [Pseudoalteromonas luteoviolacea]